MQKKLMNLLVGSVLATTAGVALPFGIESLTTNGGTTQACDTATCQTIEVVGTGANAHLRALAVFEITSDSELLITLVNTSQGDTTVPADVLTALLFNLNLGGATLTSVDSASMFIQTTGWNGGTDEASRTVDFSGVSGADNVCAGAVELQDNPQQADPAACHDGVGTNPPLSYDVSGEWAANLVSTYNGFSMGIGSAGLGVFADVIGSNNLAGPTEVNGGQYGITSLGDNPLTNISTAYNPTTQNAVQFKLTGSGLSDLDLSGNGVLDVGFQFGTDRTNPFIPIPGTLALLTLGFVGLGWIRSRKSLGFGSALRSVPC